MRHKAQVVRGPNWKFRLAVIAALSLTAVMLGATSRMQVAEGRSLKTRAIATADSCDSVFVWSRVGWTQQEYTASLRQWDAAIPFPQALLIMTLNEIGAQLRFDGPLNLEVLAEHGARTIQFDVMAVGSLGTFGAHGLYGFHYESDGRLTRPRVLVSSLSALLDSAIVRAVRAASDSGGFLPLPSTVESSAVELRLTLGDYVRHDSLAVRGTLFRARQPVFDQVTYAEADQKKTQAPRYPWEARQAGIEGEVDVEVVVRADGSVDPNSILIPRATAAPFARDVLAAVLQSRFAPARVGGCPVPALVTQPYVFTIVR